MCGFVCSYNDNSFQLTNSLNLISHRGPDSSKTLIKNNWQIGFNRLSIVGNQEDFDQPYTENSNEDCLVFNGEIYNFKELADEYDIKSSKISDTEVLYKLLKFNIKEIIPKLDGIFAFAYINFRRNEVFLARDFFGVKPAYYSFLNGKLYISSELRPLSSHLNSSYNSQALVEYLSYGTTWNSDTIYKSINKINAGEIIHFNLKNNKRNQYSFDLIVNKTLKAKKTYSEIFSNSVKSQIPDLPFGILFSGGIDSTLILLELMKNKKLTSIFSITLDDIEMNEKYWQDLVIKTFNIKSNYYEVKTNNNDFTPENIYHSLYQLDLPITHPNFLGALAIAEKAKFYGLKVLISGEGADELFCGYRWHLQDSINMENILGYVPSSIIAKVLGIQNFNPPKFTEMSMDEFFIKYYLQRWLTRADLTGMKHSIENRVPFLSNSLYEFSRSFSLDQKTANKTITKIQLKKMLAGSLSNDFIYRRKRGFDYPLNSWVDGSLEKIISSRSNEMINDIKTLLIPHQNSYFYSRIIFILSSFFLWEKGL
ncbi:asparagine synthetase B [Prochlorococcus sp. MIT 0801]|uniref:asparagine synthetase B family protein n=1 Tax=Prochlorococcus sp. MIT 0801 TaxID=1501269 RepID=UPI0004F7CB55|nr:asparagine synthase-related protein [Prochlorococcus sp. MIT 0801]AIQ98268.1 Asparagine synthetase (glutamine-hydrolyzing) [Prochlorococcus sp. MIT 0801]